MEHAFTLIVLAVERAPAVVRQWSTRSHLLAIERAPAVARAAQAFLGQVAEAVHLVVKGELLASRDVSQREQPHPVVA